MLTQKIADLKTKLKEEKNFSATMHAFFDVEEGHPEFTNQSKPTKAKMLEKTVLAGAGAAIGKKLRADMFRALEHQETGLIHGFYTTKAGMGSFFFFNDIRMGMGMLQVGMMTHSFRINADVWNEEGQSVAGKVSDLDPEG